MVRKLRAYILPNILAMLGTSCYVLADTFFISLSEGANGIAALNLVLPIYGLIYAIGAMIGVGSATQYTLQKSVGYSEANRYFSNAIWFILLISIPFLLAGIFWSSQVLTYLGADETILSVGVTYTRIVLCFAPCFMLNYTMTAFVRNDHAPNVAMAATLCSGLFNIVLDYVLMFPLGLGMAGAALATGLSPIVSMSICMTHYLSKRSTIVFTKHLPSVSKLLSGCKLGVVAFVGELSSGITTMVFNFLLLRLGGNVAVAAYGVVANLALVGIALFNGVSLGLQPLASAVHGQGDTQAEQKIFRHSLQISMVIACLLVAVTLLFPEKLVSIFNSEQSEQLAVYASTGLRLYFLGFLIAAVNIISAGFYSAIGKSTASSTIALSRGVVSITVLAFLLSNLFGIVGVWLAFPASEFVTLLLTLWLTRKHTKQESHPIPEHNVS